MVCTIHMSLSYEVVCGFVSALFSLIQNLLDEMKEKNQFFGENQFFEDDGIVVEAAIFGVLDFWQNFLQEEKHFLVDSGCS